MWWPGPFSARKNRAGPRRKRAGKVARSARGLIARFSPLGENAKEGRAGLRAELPEAPKSGRAQKSGRQVNIGKHTNGMESANDRY